MKAIFSLLLALFFVVSTGASRAMMSIADVSKERAKEMGMVVRAVRAGPDAVMVTLTFKKVGALKNFGPEINSRVELWIRDGEELFAHVPLQMEDPAEGEVRVGFVAARKELKKMSLMVIVGSGLMPGGGFQLQLADFVELEKLDEKKPAPLNPGDVGWPGGVKKPEEVEGKEGLPLPSKPKRSEGL